MTEINIEKMAQNVAKKAIQELRDRGVFFSRWIPVSEGLPEKKGRYLCSLYYAIPPYHLLHPEKDCYVRDVSVQDFDGESFIASVIAWMPLPAPFESQESEEI